MHTHTHEFVMDRPLPAMHAAVLDLQHMMDVAMPGSIVKLVSGVPRSPGARYRVEVRLANGHPRSPAFELELLEVADSTVRWSSELLGDDGAIVFELAPEGADRTRLRVTMLLGTYEKRPELEPVAQAVLDPAFRMVVSALSTTGTLASESERRRK